MLRLYSGRGTLAPDEAAVLTARSNGRSDTSLFEKKDEAAAAMAIDYDNFAWHDDLVVMAITSGLKGEHIGSTPREQVQVSLAHRRVGIFSTKRADSRIFFLCFFFFCVAFCFARCASSFVIINQRHTVSREGFEPIRVGTSMPCRTI
jgi:hypothetical protein